MAAASAAELASLPERARAAADAELVRGTIAWGPFTLRERHFLRAAGHDPLEDGCTGVDRQTSLTVPATGLVVLPGAAPVATSLRRFASGFSGPGTGLAAADGPRLLVAPPDHARVPWRARLSAGAPFRVC
jgi:hypothetical protein